MYAKKLWLSIIKFTHFMSHNPYASNGFPVIPKKPPWEKLGKKRKKLLSVKPRLI